MFFIFFADCSRFQHQKCAVQNCLITSNFSSSSSFSSSSDADSNDTGYLDDNESTSSQNECSGYRLSKNISCKGYFGHASIGKFRKLQTFWKCQRHKNFEGISTYTIFKSCRRKECRSKRKSLHKDNLHISDGFVMS